MAPPEVIAVSRAPSRPRRLAVHLVAVHVAPAAPAPPRRETVGQHRDAPRRSPRASGRDTATPSRRARTDRPRAIRGRPPRPRSAAPARRAARRARESRSSSPRRTAASSATHSTRSSRVSGKRRPFGVPVQRVAGPADALQEGRDAVAASRSGTRGRHGRCRCPARAMPWRRAPSARRLQPLLGIEPASPSRGCRDARRRRPRRAARSSWCASRSAIRRVFTNTSVVRCSRISVGEPIVVLGPHFVRHHRFERRARQLDAEVQIAPVALVDRSRSRRPAGRVLRADQEPRDILDRLLRRGQADPERRPSRDVLRAVRARARDARRGACRSPRGSRRR